MNINEYIKNMFAGKDNDEKVEDKSDKAQELKEVADFVRDQLEKLSSENMAKYMDAAVSIDVKNGTSTVAIQGMPVSVKAAVQLLVNSCAEAMNMPALELLEEMTECAKMRDISASIRASMDASDKNSTKDTTAAINELLNKIQGGAAAKPEPKAEREYACDIKLSNSEGKNTRANH